MFYDKIQEAIVEERNNFGDYSVCGDDLALAAQMGVLGYIRATPEERTKLYREAMSVRPVIELTMPGWDKQSHGHERG